MTEQSETVTLDTPTPTVQQAWSAVMGDVTSLGKHQRNSQQNFNFRGIDDVMNLVGPVLRKHQVSIIPTTRSVERRDFTSSKGTVMRETVVDVCFTIVGPGGDEIVGSAFGESSDAGDKSMPKAMSVAFRTFLLQALCLPTDEPDPDSESVQRGASTPSTTTAQITADGLANVTDVAAVKRVRDWSVTKGIMGEQVTDADGNSVPLERLFDKVLAALGDTTSDQEAEKVLADSLGATEVPAEEVTK